MSKTTSYETRNAQFASSRHSWHGLAWLGWAVAGTITIQLAPSPLYVGLVIAVAISVVASLADNKAKAKTFWVLMIGAGVFASMRVALTVLTVHSSGHAIFSLPTFHVPPILGGFTIGGTIEAETLLDATGQALQIVGILALFAAFNTVAGHKDLLEALPRSFFEVGVAMAVALAFVPSITESISESRLADKARTGGRVVKKKRLRRLLIPVLETALERAVLLSESMDARGFGYRKASSRETVSGWLGAFSLAAMGSALVALVARSSTTALAMGACSIASLSLALYISATDSPARYRTKHFTPADALVVAGSFVAPAITGVAALRGDRSLVWPLETIQWPVVSPLVLLGTLALLTPLILKGPKGPSSFDRTRSEEISKRTLSSKDFRRRSRAVLMPSPVRFVGVDFEFPERTKALSEIELEIEEGSCVVVVGNSGSGKSTLLRAVNGIVPHSTGGRFKGKVLVGSHSTASSKPRSFAGKVGFVHQDPEAHFVADEVEADIAFGLRNLGLGAEEIRLRIEEVAERLGIEALLHRSPNSLSGGEKQKCAIAAAMATYPSVLVLDEPTAQLDPYGTKSVFEALKNLGEQCGTTIVLAEHRLEKAGRIAKRAVLMEGGRIKGDGRLEEVIPLYEGAPEVTRLGKLFGWDSPPVTIEDARALAASFGVPALADDGLATDNLCNAACSQGERWSRSAAARSLDEKLATTLFTPGDVLIRARGLGVSFGRLTALKEIDFEVASGEIVAVLGKNGSGKTTLLRALAGLITPASGGLWRRCRAAYVPQEPGLLLHASSVIDEVTTTLELLGTDVKSRSLEAMRWLETMGLAQLSDRHPRSLSGGERQRLVIAAVAVGNPDILLLDEPTRGIDAASRRVLEAFLPAYAKNGRAVIMATHDVDLAASVATRVVIIEGGRILANGPPRQILPGTDFEPQVLQVLPPFLTVAEVERELARLQ